MWTASEALPAGVVSIPDRELMKLQYLQVVAQLEGLVSIPDRELMKLQL